jgi:multiple sugar transport system substrate-binding protein
MTSKDSGTSISRRRFLRVAAAGISGLGMGSLLAACGGTTATPATGDASAPTAAGAAAPAQGNTAVTEITFWWWSEDGKIWADEYNKKDPTVKVTFVSTPFADAHEKLLTSFASGSGAPDVASIEIGRVGGFTAKGGLVNLLEAPFDAGKYKNDMVAYKWTQGSTDDGRLVALPWDIGPAGVWYRTDLFEAAGYPTEPEKVEEMIGGSKRTWDDFLNFAKEFKAKTGGKTSLFANANVDIYGAVYRQEGEGWQQGNKILIEEKMLRPLQLAVQARKAGIDANIEWWGADWAAGMKANAIAGMVIAAWQQNGIQLNHPDTIGKWRVIHAPEKNYNWGGSFVAIPEQSKNKEAAWKFIQWACCSAEGQNLLFKKSGIFPAYKPAWQDPLYDAPVDFYGGQRAYKIWAEIADNIPAIPRTPNDVQLDDITNAERDKALKEGKDPAQAVKDAEAEALKRLEGVTA